MSKLTVIYLQDTKQILAAVSRAAPPEGEEPVTTLVGSSLPVRSISGQSSTGASASSLDLSIPANLLAAATVDLKPEVLLNPRDFQVVEDPSDLTHPKVQALVPGAGTGVTLSPIGVTVNITSAPPTDLPILIVLKSASQTAPALAPIVLPGAIPKGESKAQLVTALPVGSKWNILTIVSGLKPQVDSGVAST